MYYPVPGYHTGRRSGPEGRIRDLRKRYLGYLFDDRKQEALKKCTSTCTTGLVHVLCGSLQATQECQGSDTTILAGLWLWVRELWVRGGLWVRVKNTDGFFRSEVAKSQVHPKYHPEWRHFDIQSKFEVSIQTSPRGHLNGTLSVHMEQTRVCSMWSFRSRFLATRAKMGRRTCPQCLHLLQRVPRLLSVTQLPGSSCNSQE